jgi:hypothetical protein
LPPEVSDRDDTYVRDHLKLIGSAGGGWELEYICPDTGKRFLRRFLGKQHDGGPTVLQPFSEEEARVFESGPGFRPIEFGGALVLSELEVGTLRASPGAVAERIKSILESSRTSIDEILGYRDSHRVELEEIARGKKAYGLSAPGARMPMGLFTGRYWRPSWLS